MGKLKVRVDEDKCVGAGQCVYAAPDVFDQREEDGIVILLDAEPDPSQAAKVRKAARLYATAIELDESAGVELFQKTACGKTLDLSRRRPPIPFQAQFLCQMPATPFFR